jgi:hypothetical protein
LAFTQITRTFDQENTFVNNEFLLKLRLFFIVGRGRSGTTLLRQMLDAHPNLLVAPEALFIMNLYHKYSRIVKWNHKKVDDFYDDLFLEKRLEDWNLDEISLKKQLHALGSNVSFPGMNKLVYANYAFVNRKLDTNLLGDKNPHYSLFIDKLMKLYPDSKYIHMVRDYRDNILSYQDVRFDLNNTTTLAYRWKKYNKTILKYSKRYPDQFFLLKYEDLVTKPDECLRSICVFLGVEFNPVMLQFYQFQHSTSKFVWHKNISKPLDKSRLDKWKTKMQQSDVLKSDYICKHIAEFLGYENSYNDKNSPYLFIQTLPGVIFAWFFTLLEKLVFFLPIRIRSKIITIYRVITGSLDL